MIRRVGRLFILYLIMFVCLAYGQIFVGAFEYRGYTRFISLFPPALVIYTNDIAPPLAKMFYPEEANIASGAEATTAGNIIRIKEKWLGDYCVVEHEMTHVNQYLMALGLNGLIARCSKEFVIKKEIEAFRAQLKCLGNDMTSREAMAESISRCYGFNISYKEAYKRLGE
jgi:hypothetical protein